MIIVRNIFTFCKQLNHKNAESCIKYEKQTINPLSRRELHQPRHHGHLQHHSLRLSGLRQLREIRLVRRAGGQLADCRRFCFSYKCTDRRFYVRERGSAYSPQPYLAGRCGWDSRYSLTPSRLECVVKFCDNATHTPNTNGKNYNIREPFIIECKV